MDDKKRGTPEKRERVTSNNQPMKCKQHKLGCIGIGGGCYLLMHQNCMKGGEKWVGYILLSLSTNNIIKLGNISYKHSL